MYFYEKIHIQTKVHRMFKKLSSHKVLILSEANQFWKLYFEVNYYKLINIFQWITV